MDFHWTTRFYLLPCVGEKLPRRTYVHKGHVRQLLEFSVEPGCPQRCAWCGCKNYSSLKCHRCFPGPRFVMDGYVDMCDQCLPYTIKDHKSASDWPGVWIEEPLRHDPIDVYVYRYADDYRVASALREVWHKIPYRHRRRMREYLQDDDCRHEGRHTPVAWRRLRIETLPRWPNWGGDYSGINLARGHVIRLWPTVVKRMSQKSLAALVAHELAHTFQYAHRSGRACEDIEADAREIAERWGFPDKDIFSGWHLPL